jgi:putative ABC transport system permease protein
VLALAGSAIGTMLAWWMTKAIVALAPEKLPGIQNVHIDARVLLAALVAAAGTGVLFGLAPAIALSSTGPAALLRGGQTARGRGALQRFMIAAELALSVVLLVGAGLLMRSLEKLTAVNPGFRTEHLVLARASIAGDAWRDTLRLAATNEAALARLSMVPGVAAVAGVDYAPFSGATSSSPYLLPGEPDEFIKLHKHEVQQRSVTPNYFNVMGIPIVAGRAFDATDRNGGVPVAIISEAAARRDFPTQSALGKLVKYQGEWRTIVGIVADIKFARLSAEDQPSIYLPVSQRLETLSYVVRVNRDAGSLTPAIRTALRAADSRMIVGSIDEMPALIKRTFAEERFRTTLISLFGAMAALLAAVGMYGVTARAVSRRTREMGIRVALGATATNVVRLIVGQTLSGVSIGVAVGVAAALVASRLVQPYLFGVSMRDPVTYAAILALLGVVSLCASWLPARRAGRIAPAMVLRE